MLMHGRVRRALSTLPSWRPRCSVFPENRRGPATSHLEYVLAASLHRIRYDVVQSEEGGRFHRARTVT